MAKTQHVYFGQPLTVQLDTKTDLTEATTIQIRYVKPGSAAAVKTATANGEVISASFTSAEIDTAGDWEFRAYIEFGADTGFVPGEPYRHAIEEL